MNPLAINVRMQSKVLEIDFENASFSLPFEFLRVYSPSAEVRGHGVGQEILQTGKRQVSISAVEPVGNYAIQPHFTDGHNSGIFTWEYLHWLGENQSRLWQEYQEKLHAAGYKGDTGRNFPLSAAGKSAST